MFGDWDFNNERLNSQRANYKKFDRELTKNKNEEVVVIEMGAGLAVPTIRSISENFLSDFSKAFLIRINKRDTKCLGGVEGKNYIALEYGSLEALEEIDKEINKI